ncbi:Uncharacterised protein [Mycobacteroides abscessus subsp. abscessus]|uniref:DUF4917 family protein n=1 Tax=Mycobacteroides abscessus TaxID=36809 RepID=UPI0009CAF9E5|nr:DUF4917 family protein [Mycobacteroides abscessus]SKF72929.1 Uncharacterised protein [Mycobacteroides abscessus subsp. abscessus]SKX74499.1 Uncharacterised protein [Mycobacteroides abscessus subsp. abscessus]
MAKSDEPNLTFDQALQIAEHVYGCPKPSLLVGNGFSQAFSGKFGYSTLRKEAALSKLSSGITKDALFDHSDTNDFETVIHTLERAAQLQELYDPEGPVSGRMRADAEAVKKGLVDTLTAIHPSSAAEVEPSRYAPARAFLSNFATVFTLNYDLLLYWVINQSASPANTTPHDDGFRSRENQLTWISPGFSSQEVFFLHGAMHLYAERTQTHKLIRRADANIIAQVKKNLASGRYPLVVTEGTQENKQARIAVSPYLSYCYRCLERLSGALFVHGVSLSENDQHILDAISAPHSSVNVLFVGLFGDESIHRDVKHRAEGVAVERTRRGGRELDITFYQSESAEAWG